MNARLFIAFLAIASCGTPGLAHAFLQHADPGAGTTLRAPPQRVALSFTETLGNDSQPNIYSILSAKRLNADTVVIRTKLNNDIEQDLTIRREQNRVRTMQNREVESGDFVVKDGVVDSNKSETPWLTRCSDEPRSQ